MAMKVSIDSGKCCGYGICAEICPSVFKLDDQGFVYIEGDVVDDEHAQAATEAADACPELVITLESA
jgi:ferredoxin